MWDRLRLIVISMLCLIDNAPLFPVSDEARMNNCGVLVHCLAGISRSVTVTVAYLMQREHMSLNEAYDFVKRCKPNISPNFNFMGQLLDFERALGQTEEKCTCQDNIVCTCGVNKDVLLSDSKENSPNYTMEVRPAWSGRRLPHGVEAITWVRGIPPYPLNQKRELWVEEAAKSQLATTNAFLHKKRKKDQEHIRRLELVGPAGHGEAEAADGGFRLWHLDRGDQVLDFRRRHGNVDHVVLGVSLTCERCVRMGSQWLYCLCEEEYGMVPWIRTKWMWTLFRESGCCFTAWHSFRRRSDCGLTYQFFLVALFRDIIPDIYQRAKIWREWAVFVCTKYSNNQTGNTTAH